MRSFFFLRISLEVSFFFFCNIGQRIFNNNYRKEANLLRLYLVPDWG